MRVHHRSAAAMVALLLAAGPASATQITPPILRAAGEVAPSPDSPSFEFGVEEWVSFIRSDAPEYQLSALGSGIDEFGEASEFRMPLPSVVDRLLGQLSTRP